MYRRAAIALLSFVFLVSVYRAASQSITTDEAFAHNLFLAGSLSRLLGNYDASHHILYSILAKISISVFGLSEFTLRLPSLLGCLLYLAAAFRLLRRLLPEGPILLLLLGLLTLNPHLMDFMSAARGYGLAVALLLWSVERALTFIETAESGPLYQTALVLSFCVSANLTLLIPASSLAGILFLLVCFDRRLGGDISVRRRIWRGVDGFAVPGIVTAFVVSILPLTKARQEHFYVGEQTADKSLESLAELSLFHHPLPAWIGGLLPGPSFWHPLLKVLVPAVLIATGGVCIASIVRWRRRGSISALDFPARVVLLAGGSLLLSVLLLAGLHHAVGMLYPQYRTGLYLPPLFVLTLAAVWRTLRHRRRAALSLGIPLAAVGLPALVHFVAAFQIDHYAEWRFDRSTKRIVQLIRERQSRSPLPEARVGANWMLEPTLNFYRRLYGMNWMIPVERGSPDGDFDYYVLLPEDYHVAKKRDLTVLYSDPFSGARLAAARRQAQTGG